MHLFSEDCVAGYTDFFRNHPCGRIYYPRGVEAWIITITLSGQAVINPDLPSRFIASPDELLLFPPNVIHDYHACGKENWLHRWVYFPVTEQLEPLLPHGEGRSRGVFHILPPDKKSAACWQKLMKEMGEYSSMPIPMNLQRRLILNGVEKLLLLLNLSKAAGNGFHDERIEKVLKYIHKHYAEDLSLRCLAEKIYLSESHFSHFFRKQMKISPMIYLRDVRLNKARELLRFSQLPINEIAAMTGFTSEFYFSNLFRRKTGLSPRAFRRRYDIDPA